MKVLTVKSTRVMEGELQNDVHFTLGMEQYTDYVFKPREDQIYSATIVLEDSSGVIDNIVSRSVSFPDLEFTIDDLDMEKNSMVRYRFRNGKILEKQV